MDDCWFYDIFDEWALIANQFKTIFLRSQTVQNQLGERGDINNNEVSKSEDSSTVAASSTISQYRVIFQYCLLVRIIKIEDKNWGVNNAQIDKVILSVIFFQCFTITNQCFIQKKF